LTQTAQIGKQKLHENGQELRPKHIRAITNKYKHCATGSH